MNTAQVFWSGQSQALRLPADFQFDTDTVKLEKIGNAVVVEPLPRSPLPASDSTWLDGLVGMLDADAIAAIEASDDYPPPDRPELEVIFS